MKLWHFVTLNALFFTGCAIDYTTKAGSRVRFELTGSPSSYLEAGRSYRK
jgi:hypothetical protein